MRNNNDLSWKFGKSKENLSLSREVKEGEVKVVRERIKRTKRVAKRVVKCNLKKEETSSISTLGEEGEKEGRKFRLVYNSARIRQLFRTPSD